MKTGIWFGSRVLIAVVLWWFDWRAAFWFLCGFTLCEVGWWHERGLRLRAEVKLEAARGAIKFFLANQRLMKAIDSLGDTMKKLSEQGKLSDQQIGAKILEFFKSKQVH